MVELQKAKHCTTCQNTTRLVFHLTALVNRKQPNTGQCTTNDKSSLFANHHGHDHAYKHGYGHDHGHGIYF